MNEIFTVDGRRVLVEHIAAQICERCGEPTFSRETTKTIRQLVHGAGQPAKPVRFDVFALAENQSHPAAAEVECGSVNI